MKCEVQKAMNARFRILKIEENTYILDMSQSLWKILFPFLTWIIPHTIYKVEGDEINKKLRVPSGAPKKITISILFTAGVGIFVGNLLTALTDYFYIPSTMLVNSIIAVIVLLMIILVRSLLSIRNKNSFYKIIAPNLLSKDRIWIRPMSLKHFAQCLFGYIFFLVFFLATFILFITDGNLMLIVSATIFGLALSVTNALYVVEGYTTVKFKKK